LRVDLHHQAIVCDRLKGPILSRFDLVFILIDRADDELDVRLSEHVLAQHNRSVRSSHNNTAASLNRTTDEPAASNHAGPQTSSMLYQGISLLEQLRLKPGESIEPIGPSLLQKVRWPCSSIDCHSLLI
jgi:DNA helicase MCM8